MAGSTILFRSGSTKLSVVPSDMMGEKKKPRETCELQRKRGRRNVPDMVNMGSTDRQVKKILLKIQQAERSQKSGVGQNHSIRVHKKNQSGSKSRGSERRNRVVITVT